MKYMISAHPVRFHNRTMVEAISVAPEYDIINYKGMPQIIPGNHYVRVYLISLDNDLPNIGGWTLHKMAVNYLGKQYTGEYWTPRNWQQITDRAGVEHDRVNNVKQWKGVKP